MKKIYLSPLLSLVIILVVALGAGWLIVSTAEKASALTDDYSEIEPTQQARLDSAKQKHEAVQALTQDPSLDTQQGQ